jgi:hypothetical protein
MGKDAKAGGMTLSLSLVLALVVAAVLLYALFVRFATPRVDPLREANPAALEGERIQIELLNGCGVDDIAATARSYMRRLGFDVVGVGNYTSDDVRVSFVIDHVGDRVAAKKVAAALGLDSAEIREVISADAVFDASVVIGSDFETLAPFRTNN